MTVFDMLRAVYARPSMYLGHEEHQKAEQLRILETILHGYSLALLEHDINEPGRDFLRNFTDYIASRGWKYGSLGPVFAIVDAAASPEQAWDDFWRLIWDYEATFAGRSTAR